MSADDGKNVVMKGVTHGACDYLIKPVRMEALKNIWQHVVRKKKHEWKEKDLEHSGSLEDGDRQQKVPDDVDYSSSANDGNWRSSKKRKDEEEDSEERDDNSTLKKPRVVWSVELHQQFVTAVNQLGIESMDFLTLFLFSTIYYLFQTSATHFLDLPIFCSPKAYIPVWFYSCSYIWSTFSITLDITRV